MLKRDIFAELNVGFDALEQAHEGKKTLRTHKVSRGVLRALSGKDIVALRDKLNCSRGVFAAHMRINERTLEGWEQGRAKPNMQAVLLLRMVEKFPDTLDRLEQLA